MNSQPLPDPDPSNAHHVSDPPQSGWRADLLATHPWLTFVLPLAIFLVANNLEPSPPDAPPDQPAGALAPVDNPDAPLPGDPGAFVDGDLTQPQSPAQPQPLAQAQDANNETQEDAGWFNLDIPYSAYPLVYSLKIALVIAAMLFVLPGYRQFPWRFSPLSIAVGVVGVVLWVGICHLQLEQKLLSKIGLGSLLGLGQRSAFNPLVELAANPLQAYGFLAIRFLGLALIVPVIEEFFLRGFVMRLVIHENWPAVPFGTVNAAAIAAGTFVPMLMHPGELIAAGVWFSLVTLLMIRTRNIWDCVVAHGVTNLLLGVYVVTFNQWQLM